jgi:hypothetical protein
VTKVWINHDTDLLDVTIKSGGKTSVIHATQHHPFWDATRGAWIDGQSLKPNDRLRTDSGANATVIATVRVPGAADMWDLTVQTTHDFFVVTTAADVLVHNNSCRTFGFSTAPNVAGVYVITMKDGRVYVGASAGRVHDRLHAAFTDSRAAVNQAGYTPADIASIGVTDLSGSSWDVIRQAEQGAIDSYGGVSGGILLNRRNEVVP